MTPEQKSIRTGEQHLKEGSILSNASASNKDFLREQTRDKGKGLALDEAHESRPLPESANINTILQQIQAAAEGATPKPVAVISDARKDPDDEVAITALRGLDKLGLVDLRAVVVNLSQDESRARVVAGALDALGFDNVPVAVGSNDFPGYNVKPHEFAAPYMAAPERVKSDGRGGRAGQDLLKQTFEAAQARGEKIDLILISGMTDARDFIRDNLSLAKEVIGKVSIMGGIKMKGNTSELNLDANGFMIPDGAYNHIVDTLGKEPKVPEGQPSAAEELYTLLQEKKIPMQVVTRSTAYAAAVSPEFYAELAGTGHPVGVELQRNQKESIEHLWRDVQEGKLGKRLTPEWFCETFCDNPQETLVALTQDPSNLWEKHIKKLNLYDPITVIAAIAPETLGIFQPHTQQVGGVSHDVIGLNREDPGIASAEQMRSVLSALTKLGASQERELPGVAIAPEVPPVNIKDSQRAP
jgi:hypothetical protein